MYNNIEKTFSISSDLFPFFEKKVNELNKKSLENKIKGIQYEVVERNESGDVICKIKFNVPSIKEWSFIASIKHVVDDFGQYSNIISTIPFFEDNIPKKYLIQEPFCEHCKNNKRRRKHTFLLKNKNGEYKQISESCLFDFFEDKNIIEKSIQILSINQELSIYINNNKSKDKFNLLYILALTNKIVSQIGYIKNSYDNNLSTKDIIYYIVNSKNDDIEVLLKKFNISSINISEEDYLISTECVQWIENLTEDDIKNSYYLKNLKSIIPIDFFNKNFMGIIISSIPIYLKEKDRIDRNNIIQEFRKKSNDKNLYIGNIGDPIKFSAVIENIKGPYGNKSLMFYVAVTDSYKLIKWTGKISDNFEEGKKYEFIGTPVSQQFDPYEKIEVTELEDVSDASNFIYLKDKDPYIGTISNGSGRVEDFELTVIDIKGPFFNNYKSNNTKPYNIYIFKDDMERKAKWIGPENKHDIKIDKKYRVKTNPKKHISYDAYEEEPITMLGKIEDIQEISKTKEVNKEYRERANKILNTYPKNINEIKELKLKSKILLKEIGDRFPNLSKNIKDKLLEIENTYDKAIYQEFLNSETAYILFKSIIFSLLPKDMSNTEKKYIKSVSKIYLDTDKIKSLEEYCNKVDSMIGISESNKRLCNIFRIVIKSSRIFLKKAPSIFEKKYKKNYLEI